MRFDDGVRGSRHLRSGDVHDRDQRRPGLAGFGERGHRVGGFPGLRDPDRQGAAVDDRAAIAELAAVVHFDRHSGHALDQELADQRRVPRRPAREQQHPVEPGHALRREQREIQEELARLERDLAAQRLGHGGRLFVDLLRHEVPVSPFFRGDGVPEDPVRGAIARTALRVRDLHALRVDAGDVAVFQEHHVPRPGNERDRIGRHPVLVLSEPERDRRPGAGGDEHARLRARRDQDGVSAGHLLRRAPDGVEEVAAEILLDLVRENLRVGLAREAVAEGFELRLPFGEVLEDAVVDRDDLSLAVRVRVRVRLGRSAVRGPARMGDPDRSGRARSGEPLEKGRQLAGATVDREVAVAQRGDSGRIVAPVLEPLQTV